MGSSPSKIPANVTDLSPEDHPGSIQSSTPVNSDKDKKSMSVGSMMGSSTSKTPVNVTAPEQHPGSFSVASDKDKTFEGENVF